MSWCREPARARLLVACLFGAACTRAVPAPVEPRLPPGAHLLSSASQRAAWCVQVPDTRACEDFREVPVDDVVRFESQFPGILKAKGFAREAALLRGY